MVKLKKTIGIIALLLAAAGGLFGSNCNKSDNNNNNQSVPAIIAVTVIPNSVTVIEGRDQAFTAICTKNDYSTFDCTTDAATVWSATGDMLTTATKNVFKAKVGGANGTVKAAYGNAAGTAIVVVAKITSVTLNPGSAFVVVNESVTFVARCNTDQGPSYDCTNDGTTWTFDGALTQDPTIKNKFTAIALPGISEGHVIATHGTVSTNAVVSIESALIIGIDITPSVGGLIENETVTFKATCHTASLRDVDCTNAMVDPLTLQGTSYRFSGHFVPVDPNDPVWGNPDATPPGNVYVLITGGQRVESHNFVTVRYTNTPGSTPEFVEATADIHYRWFIDMDIRAVDPTKGQVLEGDTVMYEVDCKYSDSYHYPCDETRSNGGPGYITWGKGGFFNWAELAGFPDYLAAGIPGPCGGNGVVSAMYTDVVTPPFFKTIAPVIINTDTFVEITKITAKTSSLPAVTDPPDVLQNTINQFVGWCQYHHWDGTFPTFDCDHVVLPYWEDPNRDAGGDGTHALPIPYDTVGSMNLYCPDAKNSCTRWNFPNTTACPSNGLDQVPKISDIDPPAPTGVNLPGEGSAPFAYANIIGVACGSAQLGFWQNCSSSAIDGSTIQAIGIHRLVRIESQPVTGTQLHCNNNLQQAVEVTLTCTMDNFIKIDCTTSPAIDWVFAINKDMIPVPGEDIADGPAFDTNAGSWMSLHVYTQNAVEFLEGEIVTGSFTGATAIVLYTQDYYPGAPPPYWLITSEHSLIVIPLAGVFSAAFDTVVGATSGAAATIEDLDAGSGGPYLFTAVRLDPLFPIGTFWVGELACGLVSGTCGTVEYILSANGTAPAVYLSGVNQNLLLTSPKFLSGEPLLGTLSGSFATLITSNGAGFYAQKMWIVHLASAPFDSITLAPANFAYGDVVAGLQASGRVRYTTSGALVLSDVVGQFLAGEIISSPTVSAVLSTASKKNGIGLALCNHDFPGGIDAAGNWTDVTDPGWLLCPMYLNQTALPANPVPVGSKTCLETNHHIQPEDPVYFRDPLNPINVKALLDVQVWP